jgi:hypothetical protein
VGHQEQLTAVPGLPRAEQLDRLGHPQAVRQRGVLELAADQPDDLSGGDVEVQTVHHHPAAVRLTQTSYGHNLRLVHASDRAEATPPPASAPG